MHTWFRRQHLRLNHLFYGQLDRYLSGYEGQAYPFTHQVGVLLSAVGYVIADALLTCGPFLVKAGIVIIFLGLSQLPKSASIFWLEVLVVLGWFALLAFSVVVNLLLSGIGIVFHTLAWANISVLYPCYYFGLPQAYSYPLPSTLGDQPRPFYLNDLATALDGQQLSNTIYEDEIDGERPGFFIKIITEDTYRVVLDVTIAEITVGKMLLQAGPENTLILRWQPSFSDSYGKFPLVFFDCGLKFRATVVVLNHILRKLPDPALMKKAI